MIHVIARIGVKPGRMEEFLRIFKANVPAVLAEEGCHGYVPCVDFDTGLSAQAGPDPNVMTVLECWESLDHLKRHLASAHMKAYGEAVADLRTDTVLTVVEPV